MKKTIIVAAVLVSTMSMSAIAGIPVSSKVLQSFEKEFKTATHIQWVLSKEKNLYRASFIYNAESIEAYFNEDGELVSTARLISEQQLPLMVIKTLMTDYHQYKIEQAEEHSNNGSVYYLITLLNENEKIALKFFPNGDVQRLQRIKNKL